MQRLLRWMPSAAGALTLVVAGALLPGFAAAQGVATAGVHGSVAASPGRTVDARVTVRNDATGFTVEVRSRNGQFLVPGLEPGGPYTITARSLGFTPKRQVNVFLTLGTLSEIDFVLQSATTRLDTVEVLGRPPQRERRADGGTGTTISAAMLDQLPTLNRDVYDFLRLVPQISTKIGLSNPGASAGGVGFRFNQFLINGVSERTLSGGVSDAFAGNKSIPLDAVQEYQVLLTPYDVRYGDFAGALVNAVTKSGTNTYRGSVFAYGRNDQLGRRDTASAPYDRAQYGFSLGGPILENRLHFFVASEFQHFTFPAAGPYVGQPANAERPVPVSVGDLDRFTAIMKTYGLVAGSAGPIENGNPLRNLFARVDLALPEWNSRILVWNNVNGSDDIAFSRTSRDTFSLSSYQVTRVSRSLSSAVELHTALPRAGGGHNELLFSQRTEALDGVGAVQQPIVRVAVPGVGGSVTLNSGTAESAQGGYFRSSTFTINDNLTLPIRASHIVTVGGQAELFSLRHGAAAESYGTWSFASLQDFQLGVPNAYQVRLDFGSAAAPLSGRQYAAYAGDQWQAGERLSLTGGIRADLLAINEHAPYEQLVDSLFGRRTDEMPARRVELSPRLGFTWDVSGVGQQRVRGGLGIFTGRYPLAWAQTALSSYGVGGLLRCTLGPSADPPPAFNPDYRTPPTACLHGTTITPARPADVDLLDRNLRMARMARGSLAHDWQLPWDLVLTNEALATRALSDFALLNLNLPDPVATDGFGRVMYGTINPSGVAITKPRTAFSEVIDLRNTAGNRSYQLSTRLERTPTAGTSGFISYTFSRARDIQTLLRVNTRGTAAWAAARPISGRQDDLTAGISTDDIPHRVIVAGAYKAPWRRRQTELSFYYVGESGRPFTYIATGTSRRGDLNADGSNNDPIYVPRNALDPSEIQVSGMSDSLAADNSTATQAARERVQRNAFEDFIQRTSCLRQQRGQILARNSCREPWSNTTIASLRQTVPVRGRAVEIQFDVFNLLNLLNRDWGRVREAAPGLLEQVGQTVGPAAGPIFRFNTIDPGLTTASPESSFQLQLAVRYPF